MSLATLRQAKALRAYETLRAPFAGVVTARYVDPGALIPAATGSTASALPLVDDRRICGGCASLVFVQQDAAPFVHAGDAVAIRVDEQPDLCITAPVNRCAGALDPRTRTMLCEVWLENQNRLYPGTFVHVTFHLVAPRTPMIDSGALVLRNHKPSVAVVRDGRVHFVPVRPGLDDGKTVQIVEGLSAGARVVLAPPSSSRRTTSCSPSNGNARPRRTAAPRSRGATKDAPPDTDDANRPRDRRRDLRGLGGVRPARTRPRR